jgi:sugar/nucleoside kinase (ribokinase family)
MRMAIEPVRAEPMVRMVVMERGKHGVIVNDKALRRQPTPV